MTWTTKAPTEPGWYWRRPAQNDLAPFIVEVRRVGKSIVAGWCAARVEEIGGEWQGPLEPEGE